MEFLDSGWNRNLSEQPIVYEISEQIVKSKLQGIEEKFEMEIIEDCDEEMSSIDETDEKPVIEKPPVEPSLFDALKDLTEISSDVIADHFVKGSIRMEEAYHLLSRNNSPKKSKVESRKPSTSIDSLIENVNLAQKDIDFVKTTLAKVDSCVEDIQQQENEKWSKISKFLNPDDCDRSESLSLDAIDRILASVENYQTSDPAELEIQKLEEQLYKPYSQQHEYDPNRYLK